MITIRWAIGVLSTIFDGLGDGFAVLEEWLSAFGLAVLIIEFYVLMVLLALGVIHP